MGYQPGGRNRGDGEYYEGYSAADFNPYQPRHYSEQYEDSSQQRQQQQQQPYYASSSPPAAYPSPDSGTSAQAALRHFAGIARIVRRGKCEIANDSLASRVPHPPAPCKSASIVSPATAVEPTFDRSLCVETFPGMSLGPEVEAVLARVLDESERAENSVQFIEEVKRCLLYTSPSPRDGLLSRMPSSA